MSPADGAMAAPAERTVPAGSATWASASGRRRGTAGLPRLVGGPPGRPASLAEHLAHHGALPACAEADRRELISEVERAGLTGRGGAAFPTAVKLRALATAGRPPLVIANGTEGEPASGKDKALLASAPHLVLDGAVYAAGLIGASEAVVVAHPAVLGIVTHAAAERRNAASRRGPGGDRVRVRVLEAAPGFVAGEASAVVNWAERGAARPTGRPPRSGGPAARPRAPGRGRPAGRPVLVQNVETLAHLALIARHSAGWFRSAGTPAEPGSMLVTMAGAVRRPGVCEIAIGTPVSELIERAGGAPAPLSAFLIGGYFGTWVNAAEAAGRPFSAAGLAGLGSPGAGLIAALPDSVCGLAETAGLARYLAGESAGQCGPCVFGLDAIAGQLTRLAAGRSAELGTIRRWLSQVTGRGGCRHPDGAARMIGSALDVFAAEAAGHARGWCRATSTARVLPVPGPVRP